MRNEKKAYHMLLTIIDMLDEESNLQTPVLQISGNGQTVAVYMAILMIMSLSHCFVHFVIVWSPGGSQSRFFLFHVFHVL